MAMECMWWKIFLHTKTHNRIHTKSHSQQQKKNPLFLQTLKCVAKILQSWPTFFEPQLIVNEKKKRTLHKRKAKDEKHLYKNSRIYPLSYSLLLSLLLFCSSKVNGKKKRTNYLISWLQVSSNKEVSMTYDLWCDTVSVTFILECWKSIKHLLREQLWTSLPATDHTRSPTRSPLFSAMESSSICSTRTDSTLKTCKLYNVMFSTLKCHSIQESTKSRSKVNSSKRNNKSKAENKREASKNTKYF